MIVTVWEHACNVVGSTLCTFVVKCVLQDCGVVCFTFPVERCECDSLDCVGKYFLERKATARLCLSG